MHWSDFVYDYVNSELLQNTLEIHNGMAALKPMRMSIKVSNETGSNVLLFSVIRTRVFHSCEFSTMYSFE